MPNFHTKKCSTQQRSCSGGGGGAAGQWGSGDSNVRVSAAEHPWTSAVAEPAGGRQWRLLRLAHIGAGPLTDACGGGDIGSGGGEQRCLFCSARVGVGSMTRRLALRARSPGRS